MAISTRFFLGSAGRGQTDNGIKAYTRGTHRVNSPEITMDRVSPLLPVMGITRIANVTGLDHIGLPVVMVVRPNARSVDVSQGKGLTLAGAKASGVMEAIEGYHAEHIILPLKYATWEELRYTHPVADPETLPMTRDSLFHPDFPILWIEARDLLTHEPAWIPYELVSLNFTLPTPAGAGCFVSSSNGLASGNHWLEAVSHGICEVVERDAVTLWSLKQLDQQQSVRVNPDSIDDPECLAVLALFQQAGLSVGVWDVTSDVSLPVFVCLVSDRERNALRPLPSGFCYGCHPSREVALLRALTECAQSRLTLISGARDDLSWHNYEAEANCETWEKQQQILNATAGTRRLKDVPTLAGDTLLDDVQHEIACLEHAGFTQIYVVDLTRDEFNLPVVRVVIPGLESKIGGKNYRPGKRAQEIIA